MASVLALSVAVPAASAAPQTSAPTASPVQTQPSFINGGWCGRDPYGCRFGNLGFGNLGFYGNNLGFYNPGFYGYGCIPRVVAVGGVTVVTC
ncbi:hypothetical protein [Streptomyces jeddahensis]|uniref:hypothetical protein n=1 Tax=Streptomyces jeddahensis TaxID=1716141 RepID=UPI0008377191|nr:hypothetical protein [Streptomyces jeddahensis]